MRRPSRRFVKNAKFLPFTFALLFSLMDFYRMMPSTYAANRNAFRLALTPAIATHPHAIITSGSSNWSGYEAYSSGETFKKVQCSVKVPTLASSGDVSTWCGLGGDPSALSGDITPVLVQAGLDSCLGKSCIGDNPHVQENFVWWEIADALVVQPVHFAKKIHPGDNLYFYIESGNRSRSEDIFFLGNLTTRETHKIVLNLQGATNDGRPYKIDTVGLDGTLHLTSDGATVECIVERPINASDGTLTRLPIFGSEKIQTCDAGTTSKQAGLTPIGSFSNVSKITMFDALSQGQGGNVARQQRDSTRKVLALPSSLTGRFRDSFTVRGPSR